MKRGAVIAAGNRSLATGRASSPVITEYPIPTANSQPLRITSGPDGNIWFTESNSNPSKIGRITTAGIVTEFPVITSPSAPHGITAGPDGNLWFTETGGPPPQQGWTDHDGRRRHRVPHAQLRGPAGRHYGGPRRRPLVR